MKDFIIVALMAVGVMALVPKAKHCTSPYKNTLQHDMHRVCEY